MLALTALELFWWIVAVFAGIGAGAVICIALFSFVSMIFNDE